jgi:4-amino-4-deoxy-L-arabinose transferase-like glycosyltransferase
VWVDRPQGLLLVFRAALEIGGSPETMRILAAVVGMVVVVATMGVAIRICGTIEGIAAALLLATVGASPFLESFTLSGELLASLPAVLSLLAFTYYLRRRLLRWLALAGLLTGCAVMVKQSAFDAGLAALLLLVVTERNRGLRRAGVLVLPMLLPVAIAAATAPRLSDWWNAVVVYRGRGDSLLTGSPGHRLHLFLESAPSAGKGLGLLIVLAALGWRSSPLLARLWLLAAVVGAGGGGNFHPHYYIQLAPPLCVLAGVGVRSLIVRRARLVMAVAIAAATATIAVTVPLWFETGSSQARAIWPHDPHLRHNEALASYVRSRTRPSERIYVLWAGADIYYLADRRPALPYLWYRNVQAVPGALAEARRMLASRRPALVLEVQKPAAIDPSGASARILRQDYRLLDRVRGTAVLAPRD